MENKDPKKDDRTIPDREDVRHAAQALRSGGVILYPTDTVWGLGCDATNPEAVAKIYAIKRRAESKSMLTLMRNEAQVERYVREPEEIAFDLMRETVSPLTVIFDGATGLAPNLVADDGSIGIRIPRERFCEELLRLFPRPVVSTSANVSGSPAPAFFHEIDPGIAAAVDYVAEYRRDDTTPHSPSSIIKVSKGGVFKILRK